MLSTPTSITTILMGEVTGRFTIALTQGLIIMFGSALLFGVTWGNPIAAAAVMLSFSLVGAGAGMLVGSVAKNDQQASSIGLGLGLGMAAIGGSMVPLEIFPETMKTIAHVTPHAWGNGAFAELLQRGGSIQDVAREIGVLLGYAAVLLVTAMVALRRTLTR
jgi:ABC-2 type transport system permease protein